MIHSLAEVKESRPPRRLIPLSILREIAPDSLGVAFFAPFFSDLFFLAENGFSLA